MSVNQPPRSIFPPDTSPISLYTSLAAFLLCTIALIAPTGYSLGAVMLLLGSVVVLVKRPSLGLCRQDMWVMAAMAGYAVVGILEAWWDGQGTSGADKPVRFLLAIPALLLVIAYPPRLSWVWSGIAVGAFAAGSWGDMAKVRVRAGACYGAYERYSVW